MALRVFGFVGFCRLVDAGNNVRLVGLGLFVFVRHSLLIVAVILFLAGGRLGFLV